MPSKFQYHAKSIFLTYAQCPIAPATVLEYLKKRTGSDATNQLHHCAIGQEKHQDGNLHLHIACWYTHELRFTDPKYMDMDGYHPNVSGSKIKSDKRALNYISKEDPEPLEWPAPFIKEKVAAQKNHRKDLTLQLIGKKRTLTQMVEDGDINLMDLPKWQTGLEAYKRMKETEKPDIPEMWPVNPRWDLLIPRLDPPHKKRHLWIWSRMPDTGKSWFLKELAVRHRAEFMNK